MCFKERLVLYEHDLNTFLRRTLPSKDNIDMHCLFMPK